MNIDLDTIRRANQARQREWDGDAKFNEIFFANALAGESGEAGDVVMLLALQVMLDKAAGKVSNLAKKVERARLGLRGSTTDVHALGLELADVLTYTDLLANRVGLSLTDVFVEKFNTVSFTYGMKTHFDVGKNEVGEDIPRLIGG